MSAITQRVDERDASDVTARASLSATNAVAAVAAVGGLVLGIAGARNRGDAQAYTAAVLVGAWTVAALVVTFRRRTESLPLWLATVTIAGGAALASDRIVGAVPYTLAAL